MDVSSPEPGVDLATRQRQLRDLIKDRLGRVEDVDPYLQTVAASPGLAMVREIVHWWRTLGIERTCPLTAAILKRGGRFDVAITGFVREQSLTPYRDELGPRFLVSVREDADPLVAAVSQFELALDGVRRGSSNSYSVEWDRDPYAVLAALLDGGVLPDAGGGSFRTVVSRSIPRLFQVVRSA